MGTAYLKFSCKIETVIHDHRTASCSVACSLLADKISHLVDVGDYGVLEQKISIELKVQKINKSTFMLKDEKSGRSCWST